MDDWTARGTATAQKSLRNAWLLFAAGLVVALATEMIFRLAGPDVLPTRIRILAIELSVALLELGVTVVIFARLLARASRGDLLSSSARPSKQASLAREGSLLFLEVLGLSLIAWLLYQWGLRGIAFDDWPFTLTLPFLMIADIMSFIALLAAVAMIFVGAARAFTRR